MPDTPTETKKKRHRTNPNDANQWVPDPRQQTFLAYYINPKSDTFGNCKQSAIKAGYTEVYADILHSRMPEWLSGEVRRLRMLVKAEENLDWLLDLDTVNEKTTKDGEPVRYLDPQLIRIKAEVSTFIAETVGKKHYSKRTELSGPEGANLIEPKRKKAILDRFEQNLLPAPGTLTSPSLESLSEEQL